MKITLNIFVFQIIDMNSWNTSETITEIQEITVPSCYQQANQSLCNNTFNLIYMRKPTISLFQDTAKAEDVEQALNDLSSIRTNGHVNVSSSVRQNVTVFTIKFSFSDPSSVQLLSSSVSQGNDTSFNISIKRVRIGVTASGGFKLSYDGAISKPILPSKVTDASLKKTLEDMFSTECTQSPSSGKTRILHGQAH